MRGGVAVRYRGAPGHGAPAACQVPVPARRDVIWDAARGGVAWLLAPLVTGEHEEGTAAGLRVFVPPHLAASYHGQLGAGGQPGAGP